MHEASALATKRNLNNAPFAQPQVGQRPTFPEREGLWALPDH